MTDPTIIITGANGFIGESLVKHFFSKGWLVKAFVHSMPENKLNGVEYVFYDLEEKPNERAFESVNYLVHCAYLKFEKNKNSDKINIDGTKMLIGLCRKNNIKLIYLSSFSAHNGAESHYGKNKLEAEKLFDLLKDVILKPGFVIGKKGLAGGLINSIRKARFFPLVGDGIQPIQTIYIDDLCLIVEKVFVNDMSGLYLVAETEAISMKSFYKEISDQLNKKVTFISFPIPLLYTICKVFEAVGVKLPVSSENVLGLKHLIKFDTKDDLNKIGVILKNCRESLKSVLK